MKVSVSHPGHVLSAAAHLALLAATLVSFTETKKFADAQESVPVEIVTDSQLNEIMKGEKDAKQAAPTPIKADKAAEVEEKKPTPIKEAKTEVAAPPPPLPRIPDPGESKEPEPPKPPLRTATLPPEPPKPEPKPEPEPVKPEPPKPPTRPPEPPRAETPPPKPEAEPVEPPKPPQRPKEEPKKAEVAPTTTPPTPPRAPVRPKAEEKPLDPTAISKLLKDTEPQKPVARPKSGDENAPRTKYDSDAVSKMLSRDAPSQKASTAATASQQASLGSPTANAARMSPSLRSQLDEFIVERYKQCWTYVGMSATRYTPKIIVEYSVNGALAKEPVLDNPPSDPNLFNLAESALRAVRRCNPLPIPAQFAPFHQEWKNRTLRFDPEEMAG